MDCVILASGSKGNCIYIGNKTDAVIIDAGIGYLYRTLNEYNLPTENLRALLATHEHSDHVRTAKAFLKAAHIPIAASGGTLSAIERCGVLPLGCEKILMREKTPHSFSGLEITSFKTYHDAAEPTGFVIDDGDARIGVCLDTHKVSTAMLETLSACDAVVLESNYSEYAMKTDQFPPCHACRKCGAACGGNCRVKQQYPSYLKDRIIEDGHLSNETSAAVIKKLKDSISTLALAHLSENYNRPNIARETAEEALDATDVRMFVSDQCPMYRENRMVRFSV